MGQVNTGTPADRVVPSDGARSTGRTVYLTALMASRFDPRFSAFKEQLLAAEKPKKSVIAACARKLPVVLNAMMRTGTTYRNAIV